MEKKDLKKIAIHCKTVHEASDCCNLADKLGWKWKTNRSYSIITNYSINGNDTCYSFYDGTCGGTKEYEESGYTIKPAKWFIKKFTPKDNKKLYYYSFEDSTPLLDKGGKEIFKYLKSAGSLFYIPINGGLIERWDITKCSDVIKHIKENGIDLTPKNEILDKEEKEYLSTIIKPFREKIEYIVKSTIFNQKDLYAIVFITKNEYTNFPYFHKKTNMYKNMIPNRSYTLEELGL